MTCTDDDSGTLALTADADTAGRRLDVVLTEAARDAGLVLSRTRIKALLEAGALTLDGAIAADANRKLKGGEALVLVVPQAEEAEPQGEAIPLSVVYEDAHLVVIDKPAGLVVHPAPGHASGTLVNALIAHCGDTLSGIGGVKRPGIVHRLDKETSGLLVVAKTDRAHRGLATLFADHGRTLPLTRTYVAFVWGRPERVFGTIEAPIGRHGADRLRMAVVPEARGRSAITHWRRETELGPHATRVACNLETGRTHQIRVHMAPYRSSGAGRPALRQGLRHQGLEARAGRADCGRGARTPGAARRRARLRASGDRRADGVRKPAAA